MARFLGPDPATRQVALLGGFGPYEFSNRLVTVYTDAAGTQLASIATYDGSGTPGAAIAGSQVRLDAVSRLPVFWFPDGVDTLYIRVAGTIATQAINADYDTRIDSPPTLAVAGLGIKAALSRGVQSTCVQVIGDSTNDATDEWFGLLGARLGTLNPACTVLWRKWNDATQWYDMPTALQSGAAGERYAAFASGELHYPGTVGITGDIDVRIKVSANDWTPSGDQTLAAKWTGGTNNRSWLFLLKTSGTLAFRWSTDGTSGGAVSERVSTVSTGFVDGTAHWVRAVADVDNGSSGNDVKFYTSTDNVTWTQLGATVTNATASSIFAGAGSYQIGGFDLGFSSPFAGKVYWTEVRSGIDGYSVVPPLPDDWDMGTAFDSAAVTFGGAPVLMLLDGAQSGQAIAYFNDATRRPKLTAPHGQRLLILGTGHNEGNVANADWITAYSAWVTDLKANRIVGVPIVALAQNPTRIGSFITTQNGADTRTKRGAVLMSWAASQGGVYPLDVWPQFTDLAAQLNADNLHPNATGHAIWSNYVFNQIFG